MSVYFLSDPRTGKVRYVGRSTATKVRLRSHLKSSHSKSVRAWVNDLALLGLQPGMGILGPGSEQSWIKELAPDLNVNGGSTDPDEPTNDTVPATLRFPRELHERLTALAIRDERTFLATVLRTIRAGLDVTEAAERDGVTHGGKKR